jgi:hypothetical protein
MNQYFRLLQAVLVSLLVGGACYADTHVLLSADACSQASFKVSPISADSLTGAFRAGVLNLELNEDGSFRFGYQPGWVAYGTYSVTDGVITFVDREGAQSCPPDVAGKYSYAYSNGRLLLEVVGDECPLRGAMMTYTAFHRAELSRIWWDDQMDHPAN